MPGAWDPRRFRGQYGENRCRVDAGVADSRKQLSALRRTCHSGTAPGLEPTAVNCAKVRILCEIQLASFPPDFSSPLKLIWREWGSASGCSHWRKSISFSRTSHRKSKACPDERALIRQRNSMLLSLKSVT